MFAKLKQKIQEEDLSKKLHVAGDTSSSSSNGSSTSKQICDENRYKSDTEDAQQGFSITDSPTTTSPAKTNTVSDHGLDSRQLCSDLPSQELTMGKSLKEERRLREKLQSMLEKQQDSHSKRMEEKEAEWKNKMVALEKESLDWRAKFEESSSWKQKYIRNHEAVEELEGFQAQELGKVKHLLIISQQEVQERTTLLKERDADLDAFRVTCKGLNDELTNYKEICERLDDENHKLKEKSHHDTESIKELRDLNDVLDTKVSNVNVQLGEKDIQTTRLQMALSDLRDDHASLKHSYEIQIKRDRGLLDDKDSTISHLESRLTTLERRLADADLGDDDRLTNVLTERDALESKLEECRQHLNEVKTTWSEKIEALETQISHLNTKMAEDSEEAAGFEQSNNELRNTVILLENELREANASIELQNARTNTEIQQIHNEKELLQGRIDSLQTELSNINVQRDNLNVTYNTQMDINEKQTHEISQLMQKLKEMEFQIDKMKEAEELYLQRLGNLEKDLKASVEERDNLVAKLNQRSMENEVEASERNLELDESRTKLTTLQSELEELRLTIQIANNEVKELKKTVADLELALDNSQTDNSKLKATIAHLETQLTERNKAMKLQRQRLGDMKKTLQKELQATGRPSTTSIDCTNMDPSVDTGNDHLESNVAQQWCGGGGIQSPSATNHNNHLNSMGRQCSSLADKLDDINFRYVKHVILKFMTSTEYEANQLIRAIGVLLDFSREEERLVRETLNWKSSWFGTKPQPGVSRSRVGNRTVI